MEQIVKCGNHKDKNAVRICDDCSDPFCGECLRKNPVGFYYCQNCYPSLFKTNSLPEYVIPIDEKGLEKIQEQVVSQITEKSTGEPLTLAKSGKYIKIGIAIGIGLLLLNLLAVIFHFGYLHNYLNGRQLLTNNFVSFFYYISPVLLILFSYYYTSKYCGKRWKEPSQEWGYWLTLPILGFIILEYIRITTHVYGGSSTVTGGIMLAAYVISYFVLLIVSSYGGYVGAKSVQQ